MNSSSAVMDESQSGLNDGVYVPEESTSPTAGNSVDTTISESSCASFGDTGEEENDGSAVLDMLQDENANNRQCNIGNECQAVLPEWSGDDRHVEDRDDMLLWSPGDESGLTDFLSAACKRGILGQGHERTMDVEEAALAVWREYSRADCSLEDALDTLASAVADVKARRLSNEYIDLLGRRLQDSGNDFRRVRQSMPATMAAPMPKIVEAYYLHHYVRLGFHEDEMRFAPVKSRHARRSQLELYGEAGMAKPRARRAIASDIFSVPKTLADMLADGLITPGDGVLCTTTRSGEDVFADLLPSGMIRYQSTDGIHQLLKTPALFARMATGGCSNGWRMVRYNGLSLELLRNAAFNEDAALEAVAAQSRIDMSGGPSAGPPRPRDETRMATPSPLLTPASALSTPDDLLMMACELCSSVEDDESMLICDGCNLGYHLQCLTPPLVEVPAEPQWFCPSCTAQGITVPTADPMNSPNLYEVGAILRKRRLLKGKETEYLIHWQGFASVYDSWEPRSSLEQYCSDMLQEFERSSHGVSEMQQMRRPQPRKRKREEPSPQKRPLSHARALLPSPRKPAVPVGVTQHDTSDAQPSVVPAPTVSAAQAPTLKEEELLAAEREMQTWPCQCSEPCSLLNLLYSGVAHPGEKVLSYCFKSLLCFGDLDPDGRIQTAASDGSSLTFHMPCTFIQMVQRRALGPGAKLPGIKHPHRVLHYKGLQVDTLRAASLRPSRRR